MSPMPPDLFRLPNRYAPEGGFAQPSTETLLMVSLSTRRDPERWIESYTVRTATGLRKLALDAKGDPWRHIK